MLRVCGGCWIQIKIGDPLARNGAGFARPISLTEHTLVTLLPHGYCMGMLSRRSAIMKFECNLGLITP